MKCRFKASLSTTFPQDRSTGTVCNLSGSNFELTKSELFANADISTLVEIHFKLGCTIRKILLKF